MSSADQSLVPRRVADVAMAGGLLATTIPYLTFLGVEISRTRELIVVYVLVGLACLGAWWRRTGPLNAWMIGTLGGASVAGLITWTAAFDWPQAINYWSEWLSAAAFLMFGVAFARRSRGTWEIVVVAYALVLGAVQALSLLTGAFSATTEAVGPAFYGYRPLAASVAAFLVLGLVLATFSERVPSRLRWLVVAFLGLSVVLSQNRSAWLALLICLALIALAIWRRPGLSDRWTGLAITAGFFLLALVAPVVGRFSPLPGTGSGANRGLPESATSVITSEWRLQMWRSRLKTARSGVDWLFGGVFGPTPVKGPGSQVMNPFISGHNVSIDLLTMLGIVGVVIFAALIVRACVLAVDRLGPLPIVLWGLLGYGMFYNWPTWGWGVLGAALAFQSPGVGRHKPQAIRGERLTAP